jgi:hypothetical protein
MAEYFGENGSMVRTLDFGLQVATTLQAYVQAFSDPDDDLEDIAVKINSTASTLKQIRDVLDNKHINLKERHLRILKDEGHERVEFLTMQCRKVYATVVIVFTKAANPGPDWKKKLPVNHGEISTLRISKFSDRLKWTWLEPRLKRCLEQLKWLNINLLFDLQLVRLAQFQLLSVSLYF